MAVLHVGHVPFTAGLPFFMVCGFAPEMVFISRHFTQYPIVMIILRLASISKMLLIFFYHKDKQKTTLFATYSLFGCVICKNMSGGVLICGKMVCHAVK